MIMTSFSSSSSIRSSRKFLIALLLSSVNFTLPAQTDAPSAGLAAVPAQPGVESSSAAEPSGDVFRPGAGGGGGFGGISGDGKIWATTPPARAAVSQVSVLCFKEPDEKQLNETMEDIAVLAHLLSRNLDRGADADDNDYKLGIPMLLTGKESVGTSYIQGFGALLKMNVRFPLVAPAGGTTEARTTPTASEWERAKRELMADEGGADVRSDQFYNNYNKPAITGAQPYDANLVKTLQHHVLGLLKNASNIRHLDPNEWIIVKIVGTPSLSAVAANDGDAAEHVAKTSVEFSSSEGQPENALPDVANRDSGKKSKHSARSKVSLMLADKATSNRTTVMTLRVKKSAVDSYADGKLSDEQFQKSAEIAAYLNPAPSEADVKNAFFDGVKK